MASEDASYPCVGLLLNVPLDQLDINNDHEIIKWVQVRSVHNVSFLWEALSQ